MKDSSGVYHLNVKSNTSRLTAVGLTTGTIFRGLMTERINSRAEDYLNMDVRTADMIAAIDVHEPLVGISLNTWKVAVRLSVAPCTSTIGDSPVTVMVSSRLPTRISPSMVAVKLAEMSTASRLTVEKPVSVRVTE